ncbi:MAG: histidine kinase [Flavobacteriales bacterium]
MKKIVLIILFLSAFLGVSAQTSEMKKFSSLQNVDKYPALIDSANVYISKQPAKAIKFLEEALTLASEQKGSTRTRECYLLLGKANYNLKLYSQSVRFYEKAKISSGGEKKKVKVGDPEALKGLVLNYEAMGDYKMQEATLAELEAQTSILFSPDGKAWVNNARGRAAYNNKNYPAAIKYFMQVSQSEKEIKDQTLVAEANNYLGGIYSLQKQKEESKNYYSKSATNAVTANDKPLERKLNKKLKEEYFDDKEYEKVLEINEKLATQAESDSVKAQLSIENANVYLAQGNPDRAITAIQQGVYEWTDVTLEGKADAQKILSKAYEKKGDYEKALEHNEKYVALMDSLYKKKESEISKNAAINDEVAGSNQRIELLEKDKALSDQMIKQLESERKFQQTLIYGLIIFIVIVVISAYLLYKNIRQKKIANQLLALKSLRSQMNPHFIFNALNSVNSFISSNDQKTANKYLADFSKLMRSVLENSQKDFVPLAEEIEVLRLYLKLEHFRFSNKFDYTFEVDEDLVVEQYKVPPMLIQPYIENSVWHGLRYKEEKGMLKVRVSGSDDSLKVVITDDGIGRKKSQELKTHNQKQNQSMGLKNIESRLEIINDLFKTNLKVQVEDVNPSTGEGTRVKISIPFQKE